jgi:acyl CoA:acetate/3-ketoacid CoA transferase
MSRAEQIEAYVMPSGVTMQLLRETAAKWFAKIANFCIV